MVDDDVLYGFRLRLFSLAAELGNVREACRIFGIHRSTYYRWRGPVLRSGLEMLRPRERRPPRMPNQTSQLIEQRIMAFSLGHPGLGPRRISATPRPGALGRHRHQPQRRVAGAAPPRPVAAHQPPVARGGLRRTARARAAGHPARAPRRGRPPGRARRLRLLPRGPAVGHGGSGLAVHRHRPRHELRLGRAAHDAAQPVARRGRRALARRVAADLRAHGWRLERVLTDNGSEFRSAVFGDTVRDLGAVQTFIRAGRPATNGAVERVQRTILEECWRPSFARSLVPKLDGLVAGPRGLPATTTTRSVPTPVD